MAGVRQVDHHDVEGLAFGGKPFDLDEGVGLDDDDAGIGERALVEFDQGLAQPCGRVRVLAGEQADDFGIDVDQRDRVRIPPEQVTKCQTVATAEDQ